MTKFSLVNQLLLERCDPSSCSAPFGSEVPQLVCCSSEGVSPLLGVGPPSGRFAHAPDFLYWKKPWTVNPHSAFPDCSGPYRSPARLCQVRLGALICSAIPVSLCTGGFELLLVFCSPFFQLCSLLFQTWNQSCTQCPRCMGFILTCCCLLLWSVFLPQLFCLLFWSVQNTGMTFPGISLW